MPASPYAKILVSVDGGALTSGGLTVAAGASIHLQAESTAGWSGTPAPKWEICEYPDGWSCPSGWSTDGAGVFFYSGVTPPDFTLPDISLWGKFMLRLTVNGSLVDDSTGLSVLSTQGFEDVAFGESNQFDTRRQYIGSLKSSLRLFDQAATTAANATSGAARSPVKAATTANITLSGTQTLDGVACGVGDRVLVKNQTLGQNNGIYVVASGAWARAADANTSALVVGSMVVAVQSGATNGGLSFYLKTQPPITLGTTPLVFLPQQPEVDARYYAEADGTTDDRANLQAAQLVAPEVVYTGGTYLLSSGGTIGTAASVHRFPAGASLLHITGAVVLRGHVVGPPRKLFFIDGGSLSLPDMNEVEAAWFGALGDADGNDDAPGVSAASSAFSETGGGTVHFHKPPNGYFALLSTVRVGTAGVQSEGVHWRFDRANIAPATAGHYADFKVLADLGAGNGAIDVRGAIRTDLGNPNVDCNGLADIGIQFAAPLTATPGTSQAGVTGWQCRFSGTIRNARTIRVLSGETFFEASVSGSTFTVAGTSAIPGHQLLVGHRVVFIRALDSIVVPGGFSETLVYRVVSTTKYTFVLCLDSDMTNTPVAASNGGFGRWLVGIPDAGDCSQLLIDTAQFTNDTVAGVRCQFSFFQHGANTLGSLIRNSWFQGSMGDAGTAVAVTFDGTAHTATSTIQVYDGQAFRQIQNGDAVLVYGATPGSTSPPSALTPDVEFWAINVTGSGGSRTFQLAANPGGSAIAFGAATGTCHIAVLGTPWNHIGLMGGSLRMQAVSSVAARTRVRILMRPNSSYAAFLGAQLEDSGDCQDWAAYHADCTALFGVGTPQNGTMVSRVQHQNIWLGAVADAVRWGYPPFSSLNLHGASFGGNIKLLAGAGPVRLGCDLVASGALFLPLVVGSDGQPGSVPPIVSGEYTSNGVDASSLLPSAAALVAGLNGVAPIAGHDNAAALAGALAKGYGSVALGRGTHEVHTDATVTVQERRQLMGQGIEATKLSLAATTDYGMFLESTITGVVNTSERLADMTITAPSATHYALGIKSSSDGSRILAGADVDQVCFDDCAAGALQLLANHYVVDLHLRRVRVQNCVTTAYLIDLFDPNGTTVFLEGCYVTNNRHATDGCAIRAASDSTHLSNFIVESSGRAVDMLYTANLRWVGGRSENMIGPIINATGNLPPGYGTVDIEGVMFERGPVLGATPVIIVNGFGLQSVRIRNCSFEGWRSCDMALANASALDRDIDLSGCTFINCDAAFIAQFQRYAPTNAFTSWANLCLHSSIEDNSYTYAHVASGSGGSFARDTANKLAGDVASVALTWAAGATALIELLGTVVGISAGDTSDVVCTFKAWLSSPITIPVTGATNANPIVVHAVAHGLATGTQATIAGVGGNAAANGTWLATVVDADHFSIPVAGNGAYTSGGTVVTDSPVSLRATWSGTADVANLRLDVDTVPRSFVLRAMAPPGGYAIGSYGLFLEFPTPSLPSSVTVNFAQIQVIKVPRGSHLVVDAPYVETTTATRTVSARTTIVDKLQGGRADGGVPLALAIIPPTSTQPATDAVVFYAEPTGGVRAKTFDAAASPGPAYITSLVPSVTIGSGNGTPRSGRFISNVQTVSNAAEITFPATGLVSGTPGIYFNAPESGLPASSVVQFDALVMGQDPSGDIISLRLQSTIKYVGGVLSVVGSQTLTILATDTSMAGVALTWEVAFGGYLGVVGPTIAKVVNWTADITWRQLA